VGGAFLMRGPSALACDLALLFRRHGREAAPLLACWYVHGCPPCTRRVSPSARRVAVARPTPS
jgi:hypothetical protein